MAGGIKYIGESSVTAAKYSLESDSKVKSVTIEGKSRDDTELKADMVLAATWVKARIDIVPKDIRKEEKHVEVNRFMQTVNPDIYAGGDIASVLNLYLGYSTSLSHWSVARDMGRLAALNMLGLGHGYSFVPFFWTDMFGSAQFVGSVFDWSEHFTEMDDEPDPTKASKATFFFRGAYTSGVALINLPGAAARLRFAFQRNLLPTKSEVISRAVKLKDILARVEATKGVCCRHACGCQG